MTAGRRDQLVTIQHATTAQDEYGEEILTWTGLGAEWAAVYYGRGDERRQAARQEGVQPAVFQVNSNTMTRSVILKDRIILLGYAWDIVGISPDSPKRGTIEFTATATGDAVVLPTPDHVGTLDFSDPDNSGLLVLLTEDF